MGDSNEKKFQLIRDLTDKKHRLAAELRQSMINTKITWQRFLSIHALLEEAAPEGKVYFHYDKIEMTKRIVKDTRDVLKQMDPVGDYDAPGEPLINVLKMVDAKSGT